MSEAEDSPPKGMETTGPRRNPSRAKRSNTNSALGSVPENEVANHVSQPGSRSEICTPDDHKKSGSSASTRQKELARKADPNNGICLLTKRNEAVQLCHLVPTATDDDDVITLERAWGMRNKKFHLDTRYNFIFLRADWHFIFDRGKFMLIPQLQDLQELDRLTKLVADDNTTDITAAWPGRTSFQYHLLPVKGFKEPICRFQGPESNARHNIHNAPYTNLGVLTSHARPNFVVVNTGMKLITHSTSLLDLMEVLGNITGDQPSALKRLQLVLKLYQQWMGMDTGEPGSEDDVASSGDGDGEDEAEYPGEQDEDNRDKQQEGGGSRSQEPNPGDEQQDDVESPLSDSEVETAAHDADPTMSDDTTWIEEISGWAKECLDAASEGGWERDLVNDGQVVDYANEDSLPAPPPESWDTFHPCFKPAKVPGKAFDTEQFTSNDWSVFMECSPLFGTGR